MRKSLNAVPLAIGIVLAASSWQAASAAGDGGVAAAKEASASLQRGRADQAVALYTAALADSGLSADRRAALLNDRGVAYARLNRLRAAIEDFNQSVRLAPEGAAAYNNRGNVLLALGLALEAEKDFNRAIVLAPGYAAAYVNRGNARFLTGHPEAALADFAHAIRLTPKDPAAYGSRGRLHLASNRPHAAMRDFNRAVANDTRYSPGYRFRAEALVLLGRFDEAVEDLSRAIAFEPTNADLFMARGYGYLASRNPAAAIKDFQRSVELKPKAAPPLEGLALAQARVGAYDDALDTLSTALQVDPRSAQAFAYRAIVYRQMGQLEIGERDLDRAHRLEPGRPEVHWVVGEYQEARGRRDEAVTELRQALAGRPHLREAALALERLGAEEPRDSEVAELAFEGWRVFVSRGMYYYASHASHPRLKVPLETMTAGLAPRLLEFEEKGGAQTGLAILRFVAGRIEEPTGVVEIEHGAVLDLQARTVLAVETMRQGEQQATWAWESDKLVVTGLDGFKQEYLFRVPQAREEEVAAVQAPAAAPRPARARPEPQARQTQQTWNPWGDNWLGSGVRVGGQPQQPRRGERPKTFLEMLFGN